MKEGLLLTFLQDFWQLANQPPFSLATIYSSFSTFLAFSLYSSLTRFVTYFFPHFFLCLTPDRLFLVSSSFRSGSSADFYIKFLPKLEISFHSSLVSSLCELFKCTFF